MNDGPQYEATDVVPSSVGPSAGGGKSARLTPFMYCVATCPSKMFLKYVGSAPWT